MGLQGIGRSPRTENRITTSAARNCGGIFSLYEHLSHSIDGTHPAHFAGTLPSIPESPNGGSRVPYKTFKAPDGSKWSVWPVFPTAAERRRSERRVAASGGYPGPERRHTPERRVRAVGGARTVVTAGYENGWLCFESEEGEKRRLVPVPDTWHTAEPDRLWLWCRAAVSVVKCDPR